MTDPEKSHLSRQELVDIDGIDDLIQDVVKFLVTAKFEAGKKKGEEYCMESALLQVAIPLFAALGFKENDEDKITNVMRIRGSNITRLTTASSADLIAIQVWGMNPTLDGITLPPKTMVHIEKGVEIAVEDGSIVDLLYVAVKPKVKLK